MIIKIVHIPAYIILFFFGLLTTLTIFTFPFAIAFIIFDNLTIFMSGIIGLSGLIRSFIEKKVSIKKVILYGLFQFIFCIDVISSIIIYRKVKKVYK